MRTQSLGDPAALRRAAVATGSKVKRRPEAAATADGGRITVADVQSELTHLAGGKRFNAAGCCCLGRQSTGSLPCQAAHPRMVRCRPPAWGYTQGHVAPAH